jgi:hypothetical protein
MRKVYFYTYLFLLSNLFIYCKSEDDTIIDDNSSIPIIDDNSFIPNIEEEFKPFVNSFFAEMESRGLNLRTDISVVFVNKISAPNVDKNICGYGYTNFFGSGHAKIEIIDSENCWHQWDAIQKENLMYHELGHALLSKGHITNFYPNGSPKSIMCSETCSNYKTYNKYQIEQREYYLDELINSQLNIPQWAAQKTFKESLYNDNFDDSLQNWEAIAQNNLPNSNPYTFSESNAIFISSSSHTDEGAFANWYKDFTISNFDPCSNIIIRSDITTENLRSGFVTVIGDLYDSSNERFAQYVNIIQDNTTGLVTYENYEVNLTCIPVETEFIRVRFYLKTRGAATVSMDNLDIELYE